MNGKLIDGVLVVVWLGTCSIVAMVSPGVADLLIAWGGAVLLGWYNVFKIRCPRTDTDPTYTIGIADEIRIA